MQVLLKMYWWIRQICSRSCARSILLVQLCPGAVRKKCIYSLAHIFEWLYDMHPCLQRIKLWWSTSKVLVANSSDFKAFYVWGSFSNFLNPKFIMQTENILHVVPLCSNLFTLLMLSHLIKLVHVSQAGFAGCCKKGGHRRCRRAAWRPYQRSRWGTHSS